MKKRRVLGIDLGTTYSCVAYVNDYGKPEVLANQRNERTTPSVVWFDGDRVSVGQEAKEMLDAYPDNICSFIKRQMGNDDYTFDVDGVHYSPEHISSLILKKLVSDASERLGEKITDVVITCPAYFFIKERNATKLAGEMAGLNVLQIVNEPTAAAIDYGIEKGDDNETILVYDLGGGTFDVTVMQVTPTGLDVVCTDGDHQLGGKDWDDCLAQYFAGRFFDETGDEVDLSQDTEFYYDLLKTAEEVKKHLSTKTSVPVRLNHNGQKVKFDLTREEFEDLVQGLLERTINLTTSCLYAANDKGVEMPSRIILVGGSSRMPQVAARLKAEYDLTPELFDPDEAIAKGAAIIGNNIILKEKVAEKLLSTAKSRSLLIDDLTDADRNAALEQVAAESGFSVTDVQRAQNTIRNVSSKTFGWCSVGALVNDNGNYIQDMEKKYVCNMIYKNTPLPCENTITGSTVCDNQVAVLIELMENSTEKPQTFEEDELQYGLSCLNNNFENAYEPFWRIYTQIEDSVKLWEGELDIQPGLRTGSPIENTFQLDENGLLTVIVTDPASGNRMVKKIQTDSSAKMGELRDQFEKASAKSRSLIVE